MTELRSPGTISYNGVTFTPSPRMNHYIEIEPLYDDAGRTIYGDKYTLHLRIIITDDTQGVSGPDLESDEPSAVLMAYEKKLLQSGGELRYNSLGHGTVEVNTNRTNRDINFGPKPIMCTIKPVGGHLVHEMEYAIEFTLKRCGDANSIYGKLGDIKSLNYSEVYDIDSITGLTQRTVSGHIAIALNRTDAGGTRIPATADGYRHRLRVTVPQFFRRTRDSWNLNAAKDRVDFSITDQELQNDFGFPPGVSEMEFNHTVDMRLQKGQKSFESTISGSFTMVKSFPVGDGWDRVLGMVRERLALNQA